MPSVFCTVGVTVSSLGTAETKIGRLRQRLNCTSCRRGWSERSCPRSATAIHSVAVERTPNLPI